MRKSTGLISFTTILTLLCAAVTFYMGFNTRAALDQRRSAIKLVKDLGLSDPALFTEAAYIRHLSQADRHTPFQNHPVGLEHFPSGSFIPVPGHLRP